MAEVSQEVAGILPILPLLLAGRLGLTVSRYFRSSYTIRTEGYACDEELDKVIPTREDNYLDEIDRHWIQHTEDYDTRNKHYNDEDHGGYAINMGSFDIEGALERPRLMEDGNESLMSMGMQTTNVGSKGTEGASMITDETEVSTVTTDTLDENEKLKDMLAKHQDTIPKEVLEYLIKTGTPPQNGRGVK